MTSQAVAVFRFPVHQADLVGQRHLRALLAQALQEIRHHGNQVRRRNDFLIVVFDDFRFAFQAARILDAEGQRFLRLRGQRLLVRLSQASGHADAPVLIYAHGAGGLFQFAVAVNLPRGHVQRNAVLFLNNKLFFHLSALTVRSWRRPAHTGRRSRPEVRSAPSCRSRRSQRTAAPHPSSARRSGRGFQTRSP